MNEPELLPIDVYAQILAHLINRGSTPIPTILGRFQVSAEDFRRADEHWTEELTQSFARRKGVLAMTFAAAFGKSHKEAGLIDPIAGEPAIAPSGPVAQHALPSYLIAAPVEAPPVQVSSYNPPPSAYNPPPPAIAVTAPAPVRPASQNIDATVEVRAISISPALPFSGTSIEWKGPPSEREEPAAAPPSRHVGDETMEVSALSVSKILMPFGGASAAAPPAAVADMPLLTLEQYASLSAELAVTQEPRAAVLKRYGFNDETARTQLAILWARRMQTDASLKTRYTELVTSFREHLERNRGG